MLSLQRTFEIPSSPLFVSQKKRREGLACFIRLILSAVCFSKESFILIFVKLSVGCWFSGSKPQRLSIVSKKKETRTGFLKKGGKKSKTSPRKLYSLGFSTISTLS